jgi:hypothetical protein
MEPIAKTETARSKVPHVTMDMIRRGVEAYFAWDSEIEEPEALVMAVYSAMAECK